MHNQSLIIRINDLLDEESGNIPQRFKDRDELKRLALAQYIEATTGYINLLLTNGTSKTLGHLSFKPTKTIIYTDILDEKFPV